MEEASEGEEVDEGGVRREGVTGTPGPCRYAIYARQSAEPRDGLSSCEAQFHTCLGYAQAEARPGDEWIGERFDDEGVSGATLDRPAMNRLRERIRDGTVARVYAAALDRLSRNMIDTIALIEELDRFGVEMHLAHQPQLGSIAERQFLRHILASFAEFEREIIASRIAETRAYLKRHGRRLAGPAPYGYDADPVTKQLVPNPKERRRVQAISKRAAEGQTPTEIAKRIDHLGWRTKQWESKRSGRLVGGGRWTARRVLHLLRNPVYLGRFADGDSTRPGCHEPIVDRATFKIVQEKLTRRRTSGRRRKTPMPFPLRGRILCPNCIRPLGTYVVTRRRGQGSVGYRYYRCRSTAGGRPPCRGVQYPPGEVEQLVRNLLSESSTWQHLVAGGSR